jgi:hypothetical protein
MFSLKTIIPQISFEEKQTESSIKHFLKEFHVGNILMQSNFYKMKGFSCVAVFQFIFILIFNGKNLFRTIDSNSVENPFAKDTVYRFLNFYRCNWRKFLLLLSSTVIKLKLFPLTSEDRVNVLIIDDSPYKRHRSKAVELLARVYDHVEHKYFKGFRLLTMGWSDGSTFIPLVFSLLSSAKQKNRLCDINDSIDKRTNGYKRRKESLQKSTDMLIELLKQVKSYNFPVDYLLFDSWYAFPNVIKKVLHLNFQVICMIKSLPNIYYEYGDKKLNLKQLYAAVKKKRGKAKILASVIVTIGNDELGNPLKAKIVFVRNRKAKSKWLAILSTNIDLDEEEIIRIYGKRWDIEVFFKMNKSYLGLAKEFQGRSYDMMIAHTTIVFTRYIMLALEARKYEDPKTVGGLFFEYCGELEDLKFVKALYLMLNLLKQTLTDCLVLTDEKANELLDYFVGLLPRFYQHKLRIQTCES